MVFKRVDHVEIVPKDPDKTINFYVDVLGFRVISRTEVNFKPMREVIFLELGDTKIEVIAAEGPRSKSEASWQVGYRALALEVEDMATAMAHLNRKGVVLAVEPVDVGGSLRGEIRDPDGLTIELRQWNLPADA